MGVWCVRRGRLPDVVVVDVVVDVVVVDYVAVVHEDDIHPILSVHVAKGPDKQPRPSTPSVDTVH